MGSAFYLLAVSGKPPGAIHLPSSIFLPPSYLVFVFVISLRLFIFGCLRKKSVSLIRCAHEDTSFDFVYVAASRKRKQVFSSLDLRNFRECQNKFCHSAQLSYLCNSNQQQHIMDIPQGNSKEELKQREEIIS